MRKKNPARPCLNCQKELKWIQKKFCSRKCLEDYIKKTKPKCLNCQKPCNNKYCSRECFSEHKSTNLICHTCRKEFKVNDKWRVKQGKVKYCSEECRKRRYEINSHYFDNLTEDKLITLGQIIVCGHIVDYRTFQIISDEKTIFEISDKLDSTYPIEGAHSGLCRLDITSVRLVSRLIELGVVNSCLYQDVPHYDFMWEGLKRTHCYEVADDGVNVFRCNRSKIALWVCDRFSGKMVTRTFKNSHKGILDCEWVVVWK